MTFETEILGRRIFGSVAPDLATWVTTQLVASAGPPAEPTVAPSTYSVSLATRVDAVPSAIVDRATRTTPLGTRLFGAGCSAARATSPGPATSKAVRKRCEVFMTFCDET